MKNENNKKTISVYIKYNIEKDVKSLLLDYYKNQPLKKRIRIPLNTKPYYEDLIYTLKLKNPSLFNLERSKKNMYKLFLEHKDKNKNKNKINVVIPLFCRQEINLELKRHQINKLCPNTPWSVPFILYQKIKDLKDKNKKSRINKKMKIPKEAKKIIMKLNLYYDKNILKKDLDNIELKMIEDIKNIIKKNDPPLVFTYIRKRYINYILC